MRSVYFRQAWNLMRQNKVYSVIYVMGTAISVAIIMAIMIFAKMNLMEAYPEQNRNDIYTVENFRVMSDDSTRFYNKDEYGSWSYPSLNYQFAEYMLPKMEGVEGVAITMHSVSYSDLTTSQEEPSRQGKLKRVKKVATKMTNAGFWQVFNFDFIDGRPYGKAEVDSSRLVAVMCETTARQLFGTIHAAGRKFHFGSDSNEYEVVGVVKDVSVVMKNSFAQLWIPLSMYERLEEEEVKKVGLEKFVDEHFVNGENYITVHILSHNHPQLCRSILQYTTQWEKRHQGYKIKPIVPDNVRRETERALDTSHESSNGSSMPPLAVICLIVLLLAIPLIPVFNLISLIDSRLQDRIPEMGVRKVFGARRGGLLWQVFVENFMLTAVGAFVGLLMSYALLWSLGSLITAKFLDAQSDATFLTFNLLVNTDVVIDVVELTLLINIIVALVPSWLSLRRNIVSSINIKR